VDRSTLRRLIDPKDAMTHDHDHDDHEPGHTHGEVDHAVPAPAGRAIRIGIGGPVGSGKTTLVGALCELLRDELSLAVVTNDIFTTEDADALRARGVLPVERIVAVETGCCPHTAIRDDIAANLDAVEQLEARLGDVEVTLVESGGDNLTAVFSKGLVDRQVFVLDTAGGDDVPRKGGPGVATADLLVINKVDLARYVGADVDRMVADAHARRSGGSVVTTSLVEAAGAAAVAEWVRSLAADWSR
jgi:urease accessory protein